VTAETIAKALGAHRAGVTWMACCPVHEDRSPSLSISAGKDGKVLVHCHAGCEQRDLIAALQKRGLWQTTRRVLGIARNPRRQLAEESDADARKRRTAALPIWQASRAVEGTLVATYLRSRGLDLPASAALRFHAGLKHPSGGVWPAMVALVTHGVAGSPIAVHRTFLASKGEGKASVDPAKMMLGPCRGGAVRLGERGGAVLMVGEGIETCLAAMKATGNAAWAALSTSGLRSLNLPRDVGDVIVLADGDEPGEAAAQDCARRWKREGRRVRIARPPQGKDFNDLLVSRNPFFTEGAR
jgi:putative DNA primase/helicase